MNNIRTRSRVSNPNAPFHNSPLCSEGLYPSVEEQMQSSDHHTTGSSLSCAMSAGGYNFTLPPQLSPSSNFSQADQSPSSISQSISHSLSQYASPMDQSTGLAFNFPQALTEHSSPADQFSLKNFPQQPQIQQYQQHFLQQQQYQQQQHQHQHQQQQRHSRIGLRRSQSLAPPPRPTQHPLQQAQRAPSPGVPITSFATHPSLSDYDQQLHHSYFQSFQEQPESNTQQDVVTSKASINVKQKSDSKEQPKHSISSKRPHDLWTLRGSCACCHVQYEVAATPSELPLQAIYCHCAACRSVSGAASVAFAAVPSSRLKWFSGQLDWYTGRGTDITTSVNRAREVFVDSKTVGSFATAADAVRLWGSSRRAARGSCARCGSTLFVGYFSQRQHRTAATSSFFSSNRGATMKKKSRTSACNTPGNEEGNAHMQDVLDEDNNNNNNNNDTNSNEYDDNGEEGDSTIDDDDDASVSNADFVHVALGTLWDTEERGRTLVRPTMHVMLREKAVWDAVPDDGLLRYDGLPGEGARGSRIVPPQLVGGRPKGPALTNIKHLLKCMLVY